MNLRSFALSVAIGLSFAAWSEVLSTGVGLVRGTLVTSRQVQIHYLLSTAFGEFISSKDSKDSSHPLRALALDSKMFSSATQDTLLSMAISLEAQNFNLVQISSLEIEEAQKRALQTLASNTDWKRLEVQLKEVQSAVKNILQTKKFRQFRAQSSVMPITDTEARRYFSENQLKFGNLPYENFRENIKAFLSRNQVDQRLKDWYDVLLSKYQVKNLIAEM